MAKKHRATRLNDDKRKCAVCFLLISESRPVFLVGQTNGGITGPFHASCAAWVVEQAKRGKAKADAVGSEYGRIIGPGREETLPW